MGFLIPTGYGTLSPLGAVRKAGGFTNVDRNLTAFFAARRVLFEASDNMQRIRSYRVHSLLFQKSVRLGKYRLKYTSIKCVLCLVTHKYITVKETGENKSEIESARHYEQRLLTGIVNPIDLGERKIIESVCRSS